MRQCSLEVVRCCCFQPPRDQKAPNNESGNELSVSVDPWLEGRSIAKGKLVSELEGQYEGVCSRVAPSSSSPVPRVIGAPQVSDGARKLTEGRFEEQIIFKAREFLVHWWLWK